jgi:hypothetical protein
MPAPPGKFGADIHLLKLQRLQNKVLLTAGNFPSRASIPDLHVAFKIPYVCMTSLQNYAGREQKSYKITKMQIFLNAVQGEAQNRKYNGIKLDGDLAYFLSAYAVFMGKAESEKA